MRIVSLQPFVTDIVTRFGMGIDLVGVTHLCGPAAPFSKATVLTHLDHQSSSSANADSDRLALGLSDNHLDISRLVAVAPDIVITTVSAPDPAEFCLWAEEQLLRISGRRVSIKNVIPNSLEDIYQFIEDIGALVGNRVEARKLASNIKAQLMSWADSFFDRCRGKKVVVLSKIFPLTVEDQWIDDLVKMMGGRQIERHSKKLGSPISWEEISAARPDVIVIALANTPLAESIKTLRTLQALPNWENVPAVKRGEVIFASGIDIYRPGPRFLKGAALLVSAIAGLDSGYITERDEYYKIRYLELYRHRFV